MELSSTWRAKCRFSFSEFALLIYSFGVFSLTCNLSGNGNWSSDSTGSEVYRNWENETSYENADDYANGDQNVDPAFRTPSTAASESRSGKAPWPQSNNFPAAPNAEGEQNSAYGQGVFQQGAYASHPQVATISTANQPISIINDTQQTYTRTLVGPLSANACRLLDEHRKPGIFFLFQDLSVRTEG